MLSEGFVMLCCEHVVAWGWMRGADVGFGEGRGASWMSLVDMCYKRRVFFLAWECGLCV